MSAYIKSFKRRFYFTAAGYFGFWADVFLRRWKPTIVAAIGSSGKTTLLHLIHAQTKGSAIISHKANSAFGIPFNLLGLERKSFSLLEWPIFFLMAPFRAYRTLPYEKTYIAEADAERPGEGRFLAELLKPHVVVWLSLEEAHGVNYDTANSDVADTIDVRDAVKKEMAHEFGYFLDHARSLVILDKDNPFIASQSARAKVAIERVSDKDIKKFTVGADSVELSLAVGLYTIPALIPSEAVTSVLAAVRVAQHLGLQTDPSFVDFALPPGRSSVFKGIRDTVLIDSTYNATIGGMKAMLGLMKMYGSGRDEKWLVLGDMIEQGKSEESEHKDLVNLIMEVNPARVVLVGPRLQSITYSILAAEYKKDAKMKDRIVSFLMPGEALEYLQKEISGGEIMLFKGARFLEGVVEKLLNDPKDAALLCRREAIWARRRKQWGI